MLLPDYFATLRAEVIVMEFRKEPGRIYATDKTGKLLAEVTFPEQEGVPVIRQTIPLWTVLCGDRELPDSFCVQWPIPSARMAAKPRLPAPTLCTGLRRTPKNRICWRRNSGEKMFNFPLTLPRRQLLH